MDLILDFAVVSHGSLKDVSFGRGALWAGADLNGWEWYLREK